MIATPLHLVEDSSTRPYAALSRRSDDDRRHAPRRPLAARVTGFARDAASRETQGRICAVELHDLSDSGLGGYTQEPVSVGSFISVFFPPHGPDQGLDLQGRVVRCSPDRTGLRHRIGVRLEGKKAA